MKLLSKKTIYPAQPSMLGLLKLSVSDLPMLSRNYIQRGLLFRPPPTPQTPVSLLCSSLSKALAHFPALAGRLVTDPSDGTISISCNDAGVHFSHYKLTKSTDGNHVPVCWEDMIVDDADGPAVVKELLFDLDGAINYEGSHLPLASVRVTEFLDGSLFVGCSINHAVADGTSFWNFFNSWAEICRFSGSDHSNITTHNPDFRRNYFADSKVVLRPTEVKLRVEEAPLRDRIFHFTAATILELKSKCNDTSTTENNQVRRVSSSFQSLCALIWKHVTKARLQNLTPDKIPTHMTTTTFQVPANCRNRVIPNLNPYYFGNAIQTIPTTASSKDVATRDLSWTAGLLRLNFEALVDGKIRQAVKEWEKNPCCYPFGIPDGMTVWMASSPRFPVYDENNFGWGAPVAVFSGKGNNFDGRIWAFPGRSGERGSVDVEIVLSSETMEGLLGDGQFMTYVHMDK